MVNGEFKCLGGTQHLKSKLACPSKHYGIEFVWVGMGVE